MAMTSTNEFELPGAQFLRVDLFPAEIETDLGIRGDKRVVVTDTHFLVFADSPIGPVLAYNSPLVDFEGSNKVGWTATTETEVFKFKRAQSCGCGSRLRGVRIYPGTPRQG